MSTSNQQWDTNYKRFPFEESETVPQSMRPTWPRALKPGTIKHQELLAPHPARIATLMRGMCGVKQ